MLAGVRRAALLPHLIHLLLLLLLVDRELLGDHGLQGVLLAKKVHERNLRGSSCNLQRSNALEVGCLTFMGWPCCC